MKETTLSKVFQFEEGIKEGKAQALKQVMEIIDECHYMKNDSSKWINEDELKAELEKL